jgi:hypothetical protein
MPRSNGTTFTNAHLESELERYFRHRIRLLGGIVIKVTAASERGVPDRLVMLNGRMYLVELKTDDGQVSPIQSVWHRKIRHTGNRVHVIYGRNGVLGWLRFVTDATDPGRPHNKAPRRQATG